MNKLNVTSSQSGTREELVQEEFWDEPEEDIWAEIFHDKNGETVLRNISNGNLSDSERKLEAIEFEDTYFEDERNTRPKHQQIVFIRPKKDSATFINKIDKDKTERDCPGESSNPDKESFLTRDFDVRSFSATKCEEFAITDLSGIKLNRKDESPNLFKPSSMELQPNSTDKQEILSNTPSSEKATKHEPSSKTLRQNWFTTNFTNRFTTRSAEPVKPDKQESCPLEPQTQITQTQTLAKRIRNTIRAKATAVSPGFTAVFETPVLELDSIARPKHIQDETWKEQDLRCVCKRFGAKAEKYVVCEQSTEKGLESEFVDNGGATDNKDVEETGRSRWSRLKFWETGFFSTQKTVLPQQISEGDRMNNSECVINKPNNTRVAEYYQMLEQRSDE